MRTLIAHEPPAAALVLDREFALAACRDIHDTYQRSGMGLAMAKFIAIVSHKGLITADYLEQPAPDPAMFWLPAEDDGPRRRPAGCNLLSCTHFEPDIDALRAAPTRVVIAAGEESDGEAGQPRRARRRRAAWDDAGRLPSDHGGFLGGEYGQTGKPEPFMARLRGPRRRGVRPAP